MRRPVEPARAEVVVVTADQDDCPACERALEIYQHRDRYVQGLDKYVHLVRRDKKCVRDDCPGPHPIFRPPEDLRLALPRRTYGLDVTLEIGERHLRGEALAAIGRSLNERGVPVCQTHVGRLFRDFVAISNVVAGDDERVRTRLQEQGGVVLQADGVQFDGQSPVLYVAWDALSGEPLYAERKEFRSAKDLKLFLEKVKAMLEAMDVAIVGVVSDKEKGLVPAIAEVFPDIPRQYCHAHYFKNCAKPLKPDLTALQSSVSERAERVRDVAVKLHKKELKSGSTQRQRAKSAENEEQAEGYLETAHGASEPSKAEPQGLSEEEEAARRVCEFVRENSRVTGRALFDPAELKRHKRLEDARELVEELRGKKKREPGRVERWVGGVPLVGSPCDRPAAGVARLPHSWTR